MSNNPQEPQQQESSNVPTTDEKNQYNSTFSEPEFPNEEIIHREKIVNTPFTMISTENKHFIVMGKYRISDIYDNVTDAYQALETHKWKILLNLITLFLTLHEEIQAERNEK